MNLPDLMEKKIKPHYVPTKEVESGKDIGIENDAERPDKADFGKDVYEQLKG